MGGNERRRLDNLLAKIGKPPRRGVGGVSDESHKPSEKDDE